MQQIKPCDSLCPKDFYLQQFLMQQFSILATVTTDFAYNLPTVLQQFAMCAYAFIVSGGGGVGFDTITKKRRQKTRLKGTKKQGSTKYTRQAKKRRKPIKKRLKTNTHKKTRLNGARINHKNQKGATKRKTHVKATSDEQWQKDKRKEQALNLLLLLDLSDRIFTRCPP